MNADDELLDLIRWAEPKCVTIQCYRYGRKGHVEQGCLVTLPASLGDSRLEGRGDTILAALRDLRAAWKRKYHGWE